MKPVEFTAYIRERGQQLFRPMPWRSDTRPYYILVSEIMLQQTQVSRVEPKFMAFITRFPDIATLASAPLAEVITAWSGLGYNRRARFLWQAAQMIVDEYEGKMPSRYDELCRLPGVGPNTAGAIMAYAYNQPVSFIETNIRTVYIHHFFADAPKVHDRDILKKLQETLDYEAPRTFYWALMDYGSYLKSQGVRYQARQASYRKQAPLEGSLRQMRGWIVAYLTTTQTVLLADLQARYNHDPRIEPALAALQRDGMIEYVANNMLRLTNGQ